MRAAAEADPAGFVADLPRRAVLDEVQRVPSLFTALKVAVDRDRQAGRFLLTGSANVLLVPKLADSLAGRRLGQTVHVLPRQGRDGDQLRVGELAGRRVSKLLSSKQSPERTRVNDGKRRHVGDIK